MTDLIDLIAIKQAFASGHIELAPNDYNALIWCPPKPDCELCTFHNQCDKPSSLDTQYIHLITLPEWQLTLEELALRYPEYFI